MTFYLHIDSVPVADFHSKEWGICVAHTMNKWERAIDNLPHRDLFPNRHIVLTCKHTGDVIYDSQQMAG